MTPEPQSNPTPPRGTSADPVPNAAEAFVICGTLLAGLISCWMLYRPFIMEMLDFLLRWISRG